MKKTKSVGIFDIKDFPIDFVQTGVLKGTGADIEEPGEKPLIAVVNSCSELNPAHMRLRAIAERVKEGV